MTDSKHTGAPNIFPVLRYDDGPAAIEWLGRAFGFAKQAVHPNDDGTIAHAQLKYGAGVIMLGSGKADPANPWSTTKHGIYARARAAGAEIVRELQDTSYGAREYSARDLDGHLWSFGTYYPEDHGG